MMTRTLIAILIALTASAVGPPLHAQEEDETPPGLLMVVHPDVSVDAIEDEDLRRMYLGKMSRWKGGARVVPVMLKDGPNHELFVEEVMARTVSSFVNYWKQAVFTGRGIPPRSFETESELVFYVSQTPGAVGYVGTDTPLPGVKVITID